jgi:hypothetical protein
MTPTGHTWLKKFGMNSGYGYHRASFCLIGGRYMKAHNIQREILKPRTTG